MTTILTGLTARLTAARDHLRGMADAALAGLEKPAWRLLDHLGEAELGEPQPRPACLLCDRPFATDPLSGLPELCQRCNSLIRQAVVEDPVYRAPAEVQDVGPTGLRRHEPPTETPQQTYDRLAVDVNPTTGSTRALP